VDPGWWISLQAGAGIPDGQVRVGEPSPSTPLGLRDDLGIDSTRTLGLAIAGTFHTRNRLSFSAESISLSGSETFDKTVYFDEGSFAPGASPKSDPRFYLLKAEYARVFGSPEAVSHWLLLAGIDHAYLDFRIGDQSEDFFRQEVSMPVVGAGWERQTGKTAVFHAAARGSRFNHLNTGEKEGSTIYLNQDLLDVWAGWVWKPSPRFRWSAGYRYFLFSQTEHSSEDFNDFHVRIHGLTGALSLRF